MVSAWHTSVFACFNSIIFSVSNLFSSEDSQEASALKYKIFKKCVFMFKNNLYFLRASKFDVVQSFVENGAETAAVIFL